MSHLRQRNYVRKIRAKFPDMFKTGKVLEVGSLNLNGTARRFFSNQYYIGCDVGRGLCVDIVSYGHKLTFVDNFFDCIISCEAFEHDKYLPSTLVNICRMLRPGGLFLFTCASTGRKEHGTTRKGASSSPFTNDYYKNVTEEMVRSYINVNEMFSEYEFDVIDTDLRFYGVKRG